MIVTSYYNSYTGILEGITLAGKVYGPIRQRFGTNIFIVNKDNKLQYKLEIKLYAD